MDDLTSDSQIPERWLFGNLAGDDDDNPFLFEPSKR